MYPSDRRYTQDFAWIRVEGSHGTVGLTAHAVKLLSEIAAVMLDAPGRSLKRGEVFGSVEGTKAVSELLAPMSGTVTAVNEALLENPKTLQQKPHDTWLIKLTLSEPSKAAVLFSNTEFEAFLNAPSKPPRKKPKPTKPATPPPSPPAPRPPPAPDPSPTRVQSAISLYWTTLLRDSRLLGGDDAFGDRDYSGGGYFSWRERSILFTSTMLPSGRINRRYYWRDTRHLRVSAGGMSNTTKSDTNYTGAWSIEVVDEDAYLVMQDTERGQLRFALAETTGGGVLLDGRPYTRRHA